MKTKILFFISIFFFTVHTFSQNIFSYNGAADVIFRFAPLGSGGRAFVHDDDNTLTLNYGNDFTGGTKIGNDIVFKDGGYSFIGSGYFGIGTKSPSHLLNVEGGHSDSRILLHSIGGGSDAYEADLMLWASEPGLT